MLVGRSMSSRISPTVKLGSAVSSLIRPGIKVGQVDRGADQATRSSAALW
jgi:hypothetical protein